MLPNRLLLFVLSDQRYGVPLHAVERVVRAVEITPLPKAPDIVLGLVNVQGRVIPVVDMRRRFRLPRRDLALTDQMVIARTSRRAVALVADAVTGVIEYVERDSDEAREVLPGLQYVEGVVKLDDGLILIHDLDKFLSLEEDAALDRAVETA